MGYADGTILTFGERDCSIQRRHQKLIEESPSPDITDGLREKLSHAAIIGAKAVNYVGAGTFEFLVEGDEFFFMEMNTRIQVEHTVSEQVFRVDLLVEQIRAAAGEKPIEGEIRSEGHAIEVRINAENPDKGFIPSPGQITAFHVPGGMGIRVDTHAYAGYHIPPFYDSMIAKLIAFGNDRKQAISRMRRALSEFTIEGVDTTIPLHQKLFFDKNIVSGQYNTNYLEQFLTENSN
jgi:acetyl-CoA carboxylase biotin carboxylase subunit